MPLMLFLTASVQPTAVQLTMSLRGSQAMAISAGGGAASSKRAACLLSTSLNSFTASSRALGLPSSSVRPKPYSSPNDSLRYCQ